MTTPVLRRRPRPRPMGQQVQILLCLIVSLSLLSFWNGWRLSKRLGKARKYVRDELSDLTSYLAARPKDERPISHFLLPFQEYSSIETLPPQVPKVETVEAAVGDGGGDGDGDEGEKHENEEDKKREKQEKEKEENDEKKAKEEPSQTKRRLATDDPLESITVGRQVRAWQQQPHPEPVTVLLWPLHDPTYIKKSKITPDQRHILENGVKESPYLQLATEGIQSTADDIVWITDAKVQRSIWCDRLAQKVYKAKSVRNSNASWPVLVVDFTDPPEYAACPALEEAMGRDYVTYFKRSIAVNRQWNNGWIEVGERLPTVVEGRHYQYTPLVVRTDVVESAAAATKGTAALRTTDVSHFWPPPANASVVAQMSNLRNRISWLLTQHEQYRNYQVRWEVVGKADSVGRRKVQSDYVGAMQTSKMVVVAQRDLWEDHYRLWEALVSGALVVTDDMVELPHGLVHGVSVVVYKSEAEFLQLTKYYLENEQKRQSIANEGRRVAMSYHRSWHRMEEIVFGVRKSQCRMDD